LVVNRSATLPASLPAEGDFGSFILNLSTHYGSTHYGSLWLAEPRWSPSEPGPLPGLKPGSHLLVAGLEARLIAPFPGLSRLWFIQFSGDVMTAIHRAGRPIRYGYLSDDYALNHYQTIFATEPGSAEMPSAAYPFTRRVVDSLGRRGVQIASIVLHTGVSSLEVEVEDVEKHPLYPEPYRVSAATAKAVNAARAEGRRVIAIGTTVVRALESAWDGQMVRAAAGFTRLYIHPSRGVHVVDGLLTGLHDPVTSHLAMLYAIAGKEMIQDAYRAAILDSYHWHEFGDSHLILPDREARSGQGRPSQRGWLSENGRGMTQRRPMTV
jgi:S-adenosylmethionine:tRNA ribosyltransferase-isomerase